MAGDGAFHIERGAATGSDNDGDIDLDTRGSSFDSSFEAPAEYITYRNQFGRSAWILVSEGSTG